MAAIARWVIVSGSLPRATARYAAPEGVGPPTVAVGEVWTVIGVSSDVVGEGSTVIGVSDGTLVKALLVGVGRGIGVVAAGVGQATVGWLTCLTIGTQPPIAAPRAQAVAQCKKPRRVTPFCCIRLPLFPQTHNQTLSVLIILVQWWSCQVEGPARRGVSPKEGKPARIRGSAEGIALAPPSILWRKRSRPLPTCTSTRIMTA